MVAQRINYMKGKDDICQCLILWKKTYRKTRLKAFKLKPPNPNNYPRHPLCSSKTHPKVAKLNLKNWEKLKPLFIEQIIDRSSTGRSGKCYGCISVAHVPGYGKQTLSGAAVGFSKREVTNRARYECVERTIAGWKAIGQPFDITKPVSVGCAFGKTCAQATKSGLNEILERHVLARFWLENGNLHLKKILKPSKNAQKIIRTLEDQNYEVLATQLTKPKSVRHVCLVALISKNLKVKKGPLICFGAGCSQKKSESLEHALREAFQAFFFLRNINTRPLMLNSPKQVRAPLDHIKYFFNEKNLSRLLNSRFNSLRKNNSYDLNSNHLKSIKVENLSNGLLDYSEGIVVRVSSKKLKRLPYGGKGVIKGLPHPF
jgi:hypothetical protein